MALYGRAGPAPIAQMLVADSSAATTGRSESPGTAVAFWLYAASPPPPNEVAGTFLSWRSPRNGVAGTLLFLADPAGLLGYCRAARGPG